MRRAARLDRSIDLLRARPLSRTTSCTAYKNFLSTSASCRQTKKPYTERLRSKIWGTENPPGLEDPYGSASVFDKSKEKAERDELEEQAEKRRAHQASTQLTKEEMDAALANYEPATHSKGLPMVGGKGGWMRENWDVIHEFKDFYVRQKKRPDHLITRKIIRQAVTEVLILQQAGQPLTNFTKTLRSASARVAIVQSAEGAVLKYKDSSDRELIMNSFRRKQTTGIKAAAEEGAPTASEEAVDADRSPIDPLPESENEPEHESEPTESEKDVVADRSAEDPLQHSAGSWDPIWLQVSLEDPAVKFAVIKRTIKLTGRIIPDSTINNISSVQDLVSYFAAPPKSRTVSTALIQSQELLKLRNVTVSERRITPIDKEIAVGRWKVVEQELKARDLPVTRRIHWGSADKNDKLRRANL